MIKLSRKEIAQYLGISVKYVGILLHRHHIKLKPEDVGRLLDLLIGYKLKGRVNKSLKVGHEIGIIRKQAEIAEKTTESMLQTQWIDMDKSAKRELSVEDHFMYITKRDELRTKGIESEDAMRIMTGYLKELIEGEEGESRNYYRKKAKFN